MVPENDLNNYNKFLDFIDSLDIEFNEEINDLEEFHKRKIEALKIDFDYQKQLIFNDIKLLSTNTTLLEKNKPKFDFKQLFSKYKRDFNYENLDKNEVASLRKRMSDLEMENFNLKIKLQQVNKAYEEMVDKYDQMYKEDIETVKTKLEGEYIKKMNYLTNQIESISTKHFDMNEYPDSTYKSVDDFTSNFQFSKLVFKNEK